MDVSLRIKMGLRQCCSTHTLAHMRRISLRSLTALYTGQHLLISLYYNAFICLHMDSYSEHNAQVFDSHFFKGVCMFGHYSTITTVSCFFLILFYIFCFCQKFQLSETHVKSVNYLRLT